MKPHWWDDEIAIYVEGGTDPDKARTVTILRWLWCGDLRPLEAAIVEGQDLDQSVLNLLADMISSDATRNGSPPPYRLKALPLRGRGRPKRQEPRMREIALARAYEARSPSNSDLAFEEIAEAVGVSPSTVRQAVTAYRKKHPKAHDK
jgi:hypothetical protein